MNRYVDKPAASGLRIVISGLAVTYPFGGVFWDYVNYMLGFARLGHDVLYLEDTGKWVYDPEVESFVGSGAKNARKFGSHLCELDPKLASRWFFRDTDGVCYGKSWNEARDFCRSSDLFVHLSAASWMRDEYIDAPRVAFVDTDPIYSQASAFPECESQASAFPECERTKQASDYMDALARSRLFTFAENITRPGCEVPSEPFHWTPTRQPIVLDAFLEHGIPPARRRKVLTTVSSWEPTQQTGPVVGGKHYHGKSAEILRFLDLPRRMPLPVEIAISGAVPRQMLARHGWLLRDPLPVSHDPWVYRDYLANSMAELSVAKNAYVESQSGWFSCRTACYLALGVPAVVQDTGFSQNIPCGRGLFAFSTAEQARAGVDAIITDPERHAAGARDLAAEYFDSGRILTRFLEQSSAQSTASGEAAMKANR